MCRRVSDKIVASTVPRAGGEAVSGTKAFGSLCMIVLEKKRHKQN